jgi:hypothetical protein
MSSPWIDLLFLHGHVTPARLAWRDDAPADSRHSGTLRKVAPSPSRRATVKRPSPRPLAPVGA